MKLGLGSFIKKADTDMFGLDISTSGIRVMELSRSLKGDITVEAAAYEQLPRGAVVDGSIDNIDLVTEAIRKAWAKSGIRTKNAVLGMPSSAVITRKLIIPGGMTEDEIELRIQTEASQYIPFPLEDVNLDFTITGPATGSFSEDEVIVVAAKKDKVEDRVIAAESAGLTPIIMDIDSNAAMTALEHAISSDDRGKLVGLLRIGAQVSSFIVLSGMQTVYERDHPFGGNQLTQEIARHYGLNFETAEQRKRARDLPEAYEQNVLQPYIQNIAHEVSRTMQLFLTSSSHTTLDHLFIAGGGSMLPGLAEEIAKETKVNASIARAFNGMRFSPKTDRKLQNEEPAYLIACGLAMRRFDND